MREVLLGQAPASRDVADRANGLVDAARPMPTSRINKHLKYLKTMGILFSQKFYLETNAENLLNICLTLTNRTNLPMINNALFLVLFTVILYLMI